MEGTRRRSLLRAVILASVVSVTMLAGATWRLVENERDLERQRTLSRLELVADAVLGRLEAGLADRVRRAGDPLPARVDRGLAPSRGDGSFRVTFDRRGGRVDVDPEHAVNYLPGESEPLGLPDPRFAEAERLEFRRKDLAAAADHLRALVASESQETRAEALLRLARVQAKMGGTERALETLEELAAVDVALAGVPAELVARFVRCELLAETTESLRLGREAAELLEELRGGRWRLPSGRYLHYRRALREWSDGDEEKPTLGEARAQLVGRLREGWREAPAKASPDSPVRAEWVGEEPFLIAEAVTENGRTAIVEGRPAISALLASAVGSDRVTEVLLSDPLTGRIVAGRASATSPRIARTPSETGLPWTVHLAAGPSTSSFPDARTWLLVGGASVIGMLFVGSVWMFSAAALRQMRLARMQADFLAAVSHEFRSPLTSVRHASELLADPRLSEDRRRMLLRSLARESARLEGLVEDLLDFRRLQEGTLELHPAVVDAREYVSGLAGKAQERLADSGVRLELQLAGCEDAPILLEADTEALGRAVENLIENAAAYSPDCDTVWLVLDCAGESVHLRVRDRGIGIDPGDQEDIFERFVRGSRAVALRSRGAGLGLALVREIARAHGGTVAVSSRPGDGSTFSITLPRYRRRDAAEAT